MILQNIYDKYPHLLTADSKKSEEVHDKDDKKCSKEKHVKFEVKTEIKEVVKLVVDVDLSILMVKLR